MQRFIVGLAGIAIVVFAFVTWANAQADGLDLDLSTIVASESPAPSEPASAEPVQQQQDPEPQVIETEGDATPAQKALMSLASVGVTPATRVPAYDRDLFGSAWADIDGNGCRQRDDVLARDMTNVTTEDGCKVLTGVLNDPYTGTTISFTFGAKTSQAVQIDHIHSLSGAWKAGAWAWTAEQRKRFANDFENLLAVSGKANGPKSDKGPADWMPSTSGNAAYDCTYAIDYTHILVKYDLTAPAADIAALRDTLTTC